MQHVGSWFPNLGWNPCPLQKRSILATGPPGRFQNRHVLTLQHSCSSLSQSRTQVYFSSPQGNSSKALMAVFSGVFSGRKLQKKGL